MFSRFREWVRKAVNRLLNKDLVAKKLNIDVAVSNNMSNAIDLWSKIYENKAPWLDDDIKSLNLGSVIANEVARLVTVEFESEMNERVIDSRVYLVVIIGPIVFKLLYYIISFYIILYCIIIVVSSIKRKL